MAPLILLALIAGFYWKLTLTRQYDWGWGPDFATQVLPWFHVQARQWHNGEFPLWDPYLWGGQPLLGQAQPGSAYPLNWLLFLLPLDGSGAIKPGFLQGYFIAIHYMGALFCYWLCRDLGRSRAASVFAGLAFSLTGFLGTRNWPQMINGCVWAPLTLLFALRAIRSDGAALRQAAFGGAALGMAWLSGHHQIPLYTSIAMAAVWLDACIRHRARVRAAAVFFVFTGLVGALQILPAQEYGKLAKRWAGVPEGLAWNHAVPYPVHEEYSLSPKSIAGLATNLPERTLDPYMGVAFVTLAPLGIALAWGSPQVRLFACLAGGAWIYALGGFTFAHGLFYLFVPIAEKARTPAVALHLFHLAAAVLAAFGLDALRKAPARSRALRRATIALVALGAILAIDIHLRPPDLDPRFGLSVVAAWLTAACLRWRHARPAFIAILLIEASANTGALIAPRSDKGRTEWIDRMRDNRDIARFLKSQPEPFRVTVLDRRFEENWGAWHGIEMRHGYLASMTSNMADWPHGDNGNRIFNTKFAIGTEPRGFHRIPVFRGASGLTVFADADALPRAWAVHRVERLADIRALHVAMHERHADFRHTAFFPNRQPPRLPACDGTSTVEVIRYSASSIRVRARMNCDGLVVIAMTNFPGWSATIGGRATPIVETNGVMPALMVAAGEHEIEIRYRPRSVAIGAVLTAIGWVATLILAVRRDQATG